MSGLLNHTVRSCNINHFSTASVYVITITSIDDDGKGGIEVTEQKLSIDYYEAADLMECLKQFNP